MGAGVSVGILAGDEFGESWVGVSTLFSASGVASLGGSGGGDEFVVDSIVPESSSVGAEGVGVVEGSSSAAGAFLPLPLPRPRAPPRVPFVGIVAAVLRFRRAVNYITALGCRQSGAHVGWCGNRRC